MLLGVEKRQEAKPRSRRIIAVIIILVILYAAGSAVLYGPWALRPVFHKAAPYGCVDGDAVYSASVPTRYGSAVSNLWNLQAAEGEVSLCYARGGVNETVSLSDVKVQGPPPNFVGYPEVGYGMNLEGESFGAQSNDLIFPMRVLSFSQLNPFSNTTFSTSRLSAGAIDIGYDIWLKGRVAGATASTDYEVMILFYFPYSCASYSSAVYKYANTIYVDSTPRDATWTVCVAAAGTHARLVSFTLSGMSQIAEGRVALKPMDFISFVQDRVKGTAISSYYIEGMEFGTEFWSSSAGMARYDWTLSSWSLGSGSSDVIVVG